MIHWLSDLVPNLLVF